MLRAGEPAGELQAPALIGGELRLCFQRGLDDLDEAALHRLSEGEVVAADVDGQFLENLRRFGDRERRGQVGQAALGGHHRVLQRAHFVGDFLGVEHDGLGRQG